VGSEKMKVQSPSFFFTASFLRRFAEHYYNLIKQAREDSNLDAFKHFLYNSSGSILIDEKLDIEPYPMLKRIYQTDGAQYKIFRVDPELSRENREIQAFEQFSASFSELFNQQKLEALESMFQKPLFDLAEVAKRWRYISGQNIPALKEGTSFEWESFLKLMLVPTSQILICDSYLTTSKDNIHLNLFPILRAIHTLIHFKGEITIISTHPSTRDLRQMLSDEFGDAFSFIFATVESTSIKLEHDRRIITDSMLLNIPAGLDIISKFGKIKKNTEPILKSVFSGDLQQQETLNSIRSHLYKEAGRLSSRRGIL